MMPSIPAPRLAAVSLVGIIALAIAWPVTIVVGGSAYVLAPVLREWSSGGMAAIGFHIRVVPFSETWPGYAILVLPPIALVATWLYLRRRQRGDSLA